MQPVPPAPPSGPKAPPTTVRRSTLTSLLLHTAVLSAAIWVTVRAWPVAAAPMAARVRPATAVATPAPDDAPPDPALPPIPAPAHAPIPLPADPPPPDDSVESAPRDAPWIDALEIVPQPRDWDAITRGYGRRLRPPIQVAGPTPPPAAPALATDAAASTLVPPVPTHQPAPRRPSASRHRTGTVVLRLRVSVEGTVSEARVHSGSGVVALDTAAVRAAMEWRFQPARRDGVAEAAWVEVPVRF